MHIIWSTPFELDILGKWGDGILTYGEKVVSRKIGWESLIYTILTAKPAEEGSTSRAGVTITDQEPDSNDATSFARYRLSWSPLTRAADASGQAWGLLRCAELPTKIKIAWIALSISLWFIDISATATKGERKGIWRPPDAWMRAGCRRLEKKGLSVWSYSVKC